MILQELRELANAAQWIESQDFARADVHWLLRIDLEGKPMRDPNGKLACWFALRAEPPPGSKSKPRFGRSFTNCPKVDRPSGSRIRADYLVGRFDRMLFAWDELLPPAKTKRDAKNRQWKIAAREETGKLANVLAVQTGNAALVAVSRLYQSLESDGALRAELLSSLRERMDADGAALDQLFKRSVAFTLVQDDLLPMFERQDTQAIWREHRSNEKENNSSGNTRESIPCLCCKRLCDPVRIHETKIKGLPGPGRSGVSLIAYNKKSFWSQGFRDSLNAPTCQQCVDAYSTALNRLLQDYLQPEQRHPSFGGSVRTAGLAFCYWCREPLEAARDPMRLLYDAPVKQVSDLINALRSGESSAVPTTAVENFFVLPMSAPSKGRAVVHDWITTSLERLHRNLAEWFSATAIIDPYTGKIADPVRLADPPPDVSPQVKAQYLKRHIPSALGRWHKQKRQWDVPARLMTSIIRFALRAEPLPLEVLQLALGRLRAEIHNRDRDAGHLRGFTTARLGLMRAALNQQLFWKGELLMPGLDRTRHDPPYVCGRLLAVLSRIQAKAIAGIQTDVNTGQEREQRLSASIVSRYYGAASSRPATGLYVPMRMRIAHLNKLDRDYPASATRFRKEVQQILGLLVNLPKTLSPAEQCVFAIGFEHQMAELFRPKHADSEGAESVAHSDRDGD
jgi:CRISPR-associated protein Csd1